MAEAAKWFRYLGEKFPDKTLLDSDPNSFPRNLTLDEYAVGRVQEDIGDTSQERDDLGRSGTARPGLSRTGHRPGRPLRRLQTAGRKSL